MKEQPTKGPLTYENDEETFEKWLIRDESTDNRDVVAEVPKTGDEDYDNRVTFPNVKLFTAAPKLLTALQRLTVAASARENVMGDPCRLLECQAELRAATEDARAAIAEAAGKNV